MSDKYVVKERHSVSTLKGIIGPGEEITAKHLVNGEEGIKMLLAREVSPIEKVGEKKEIEKPKGAEKKE